MLYNNIVVLMKKPNMQTLTIVIGGDMDKDEPELLNNPEKGMLQPRNILYLDSFEDLHEFLSPKKLDLLYYLMKDHSDCEEKCVGAIAKNLKRQQEAISRDLHSLKKLNLVNLKKVSQTVLANATFGSINIKIMKPNAAHS